MSKRCLVEIKEYDPMWPLIFDQLRNVISRNLMPYAISIEHIRNTSVPGLAARPIIDLDVVIESNRVINEVIDRLSTLGYEYQGDLGIQG